MRNLVTAAAILLVATGAVAAPPPMETLTRLEDAMGLLESDRFAGSYTLTTRSVVAKPGGKDPQATEMVMAIRHSPGRVVDQQLVRATRNGADITEELRTRLEKADEKRGNRRQRDDDDEASVGLEVPKAETLARYRFVGPDRQDGVLVAAFSPSGKDKAGVTGRLAWDPATLDPLWVELEPVVMPRHVKRLHTRVELGRSSDILCPRRTVMEGLGGFLLVKREFRVEMELSDVTVGDDQGAAR